jgi:beta-glucosidase/6-phospho-beta-glucosidase/beta-galactosidase
LDWTHEDDIMPKFVAYAEFCFARFGDRVKYWVR